MTIASATPLRFPETSSSSFMTRRGWFLLVMNLLVPGSAQVLAGSRRLGRFGLATTLVLWAAAIIALLLFFIYPTALYTIATIDVTMLLLQILLVGYAVLWLVLTLDTLRLIRVVKVLPRPRAAMAILTTLLLVFFVGGGGYATYILGVSRGLLSDVFGDGSIAAPVDGRYNIMLLGGDAGDDRDGLRPDSISVVSIDANTGAATIIGLTREMQNIPFPEDSPMYSLYPDGYLSDNCNVDPCKLNSIYTEVELKEADLYPDAEAEGSEPGIEAMRDALEGILDLPIQYYALIDMQGFADLIDALGGIDINYTGEDDLPFGGTLDEDGDLVGVNAWLTPGEHHLDGNNALAYARSRYGSSGGDFDRMARQREVQEALLKQFEPANVLSKFQGIAQAGSQVVKTDVPQSMLGFFVQLALKTKSQQVASLELVPPAVDYEDPDYDAIRAMVQTALFPDDTSE